MAEKNNISRIELYSIDSMTLSDKQVLNGARDGKPVRLAGELRLPVGVGPFPAMVLVHSSFGVSAGVDRWARELNGLGVAAVLLDSFSGRGIVHTINDQSQIGGLAMIYDAYRALQLLAGHRLIDASRIGVLGFSKGGFAALYAAMRRFQRAYAPANAEFAAYVAFYARADVRFREDEDVSDRPIRLHHGEADDWIPVGPTRAYVQRLQKAGKDVQLATYPGARHSFDSVNYPNVFRFEEAEISAGCRREESAAGEIINMDTGKPANASDPCVKRGASVGYNPEAHEAALKSVKEFLSATFALAERRELRVLKS
jgi:dienelactone hydrolase